MAPRPSHSFGRPLERSSLREFALGLVGSSCFGCRGCVCCCHKWCVNADSGMAHVGNPFDDSMGYRPRLLQGSKCLWAALYCISDLFLELFGCRKFPFELYWRPIFHFHRLTGLNFHRTLSRSQETRLRLNCITRGCRLTLTMPTRLTFACWPWSSYNDCHPTTRAVKPRQIAFKPNSWPIALYSHELYSIGSTQIACRSAGFHLTAEEISIPYANRHTVGFQMCYCCSAMRN